MKPAVSEILSQVPSPEENLRVITKDVLPDGRAYQLSFMDLKSGALRPNVLAHLSKEPAFHAYPEWANDRGYRLAHKEQQIPFVYASEEGLDLINDLTPTWVLENITNPDTWINSPVIGGGSESEVRRIELAGRDCVLKRVHHENIKGLDKTMGAILRGSYSAPHYVNKFGSTTQVAEVLNGLPEKPASFTLGRSPTEYFAGKDFTVEEYIEGKSLGSIVAFAFPEGRWAGQFGRVVELSAATLDEVHAGHTRRQWREWLDVFDKDAEQLTELFFVAGYERKNPFNQGDFAYGNWLYTGDDPETGNPVLSLIDQAPAQIILDSTADFVRQLDDTSMHERLCQKYKDSPLLAYMRQVAPPKLVKE